MHTKEHSLLSYRMAALEVTSTKARKEGACHHAAYRLERERKHPHSVSTLFRTNRGSCPSQEVRFEQWRALQCRSHFFPSCVPSSLLSTTNPWSMTLSVPSFYLKCHYSYVYHLHFQILPFSRWITQKTLSLFFLKIRSASYCTRAILFLSVSF